MTIEVIRTEKEFNEYKNAWSRAPAFILQDLDSSFSLELKSFFYFRSEQELQEKMNLVLLDPTIKYGVNI